MSVEHYNPESTQQNKYCDILKTIKSLSRKGDVIFVILVYSLSLQLLLSKSINKTSVLIFCYLVKPRWMRQISHSLGNNILYLKLGKFNVMTP